MRSLHCPTRLRVAAWAVLALAVLVGHGLVWQALRPTPGIPALQVAKRPAPQLVLRTLAPATPALLPAAPAEAPARRSAPAVARAVAVAAPAPQPPTVAPERSAPAGTAELPVYATRLPDPARLHYRLQRGGQVGIGWLHWQRGDTGYELRLDVEWPGQPPQGSASRGQIDAEGVAPVRHAELHRARELRAVNFQRKAATITFSGPQGTTRCRPERRTG